MQPVLEAFIGRAFAGGALLTVVTGEPPAITTGQFAGIVPEKNRDRFRKEVTIQVTTLNRNVIEGRAGGWLDPGPGPLRRRQHPHHGGLF
mgnify:CR=1 FL=1